MRKLIDRMTDPSDTPSVGDWIRIAGIGSAAFAAALMIGPNSSLGLRVVTLFALSAATIYAVFGCGE